MTDKEKVWLEDLYLEHRYTCFLCDNRATQGAHIIGNTKANRKRYGALIIDSPLNRLPCCGLKHNALIDMGHASHITDHIASLIDRGEKDMIHHIVRDNVERKLSKV